MITMTPLAAGHLWMLLHQEPDSTALGIRIRVTTTGCNSFAYSLAITEPGVDDQIIYIHGLRMLFRDSDVPFVDGLMIDFQLESGKLQLYHPNPPSSSCPLPTT